MGGFAHDDARLRSPNASLMSAADSSLRYGSIRSTARAVGHASVTPILSFDTSRGVTVSVIGIADAALVSRITGAAKRSLKHVVGKWSVSIAPYASRGQWRMELRGTSGIHLWTFASRADRLPDGTADKLSAFLKRAASARAIR
jgi:hypothetical protein